jgi:hypothetical protein
MLNKWNYWRAVQPLPGHGLWRDGIHLTIGVNNFEAHEALKAARPVRNLTGLQTLYQVWMGLNQ